MTTATTTALEDRTTPLRTPRQIALTLRTTLTLIWVWVEVWPPLLATTYAAGHYGTLLHPFVVAGGLVTLTIWARAWRTGALAKNVTDTLAARVWLDWRKRELDTWQLAHLLHVRVADPLGPKSMWTLFRMEGRRSVPARTMEVTVRPNDSQGTPEWEARFTDYITRRYGFEGAFALPSPESINCLSITLSARAIPDRVWS
jgi:hypothetical protein